VSVVGDGGSGLVFGAPVVLLELVGVAVGRVQDVRRCRRWRPSPPHAAAALKKVSQLLIDLRVPRSHSWPKVSNDNPCREAQFKTTKYMSDYPERFDSSAHARAWFDAFIAYCSHEHWHSGIGWHTPASVHFGTAGRSATSGPSPSPRHTPAAPNASAAAPDHPRYPRRPGSTTRPSAANPHHKSHSDDRLTGLGI
jgi:putative transposase